MIIQETEKEQRDFAKIPNSTRIEISRIIYPLPQAPVAKGRGKNISGAVYAFPAFLPINPEVN